MKKSYQSFSAMVKIIEQFLSSANPHRYQSLKSGFRRERSMRPGLLLSPNTALINTLNTQKNYQMHTSTLAFRSTTFQKMFHFLTLVLTMIILSLTNKVQGQASIYTYAASTGASLETITSPVVVTTVDAGSLDDGSKLVTPSPAFSFTFNGTAYTQFQMVTNGWVRFGSTAPGTTIPSSLTSIGSLNAVYCFGRDANLNTGNGGNFTHGPAAGGKYVLQWTNNSGGGSGGTSSTAYATFQVVLWGASSTVPGRIEIIYGPSIGSPSSNGTIGISDASNTYVNGVNGLNNSLTTASSYPASGTKYTFAPPVCATPTAAPGGVALTPTVNSVTSLTGTITASTPASSGYLVVRTTSSSPAPVPVDGTAYTAGANDVSLGGFVESNGPSTSFTSIGLSPSTTYYYWVFSTSGKAPCAGTPNLYFGTPVMNSGTTASPVAVSCNTAYQPTDGSTNILPVNVSLLWSGAGGFPSVNSYNIYFSNNQALVAAHSGSVKITQSATTYAIPTTLLFNTTYYWTVVPKNDTDSATNCGINSFTTSGPNVPPCPTTFTPAGSATNVSVTASLSWNAVTSAPVVTGYDVYVDTVFANVFSQVPSVKRVSNTSSTSFTPGISTIVLAPGKTYYWLVIPINTVGSATGCDVKQFTTYTPANFTSTAKGGLWTETATWTGGVVPSTYDDVTIANNSIVTVNTSGITVRNLTINSGGIVQWNGTANSISIVGNLTVASGAKFLPYSTSPTGVTVNIGGNFTNNGYANCATASTVINFNGSQAAGGSLAQTLNGSGTFQGNGSVGIIRSLYFQTTGSSVINTSQNLATHDFKHTAGSLNTNGKLAINNGAQVYGQALNLQVASIAVTNSGSGYTTAPVIAAASSANWATGSVSAGAVKVTTAGNVYVVLSGSSATAGNSPTHTYASPGGTGGIASTADAISWLWVGNTGTLGTALFSTSLTPTVNSQYFYGTKLFTCTVSGAVTAANITAAVMNNFNAATTGTTVTAGGATYLCVGTAAQVTVNHDATSSTLRSINLTNTGSGYYTTAPGLAILNTGAGSSAAATAVFFQQIIGPAGSTTSKTPSATLNGGLSITSNQSVVGLSTTAGGNGYTAAPTVGFSLPINFDNLITNPGSGYTTAVTVALVAGTGTKISGTTDPTFTAVVARGKVVSVICTAIGNTLWTTLPNISITGGGGTGATAAFPANCLATATAVITNGTITGFNITNAGSGYNAVPTVGLVAGTAPLTAATAPTARLGNYNLIYNFFTPATSNPESLAGAEMPARINTLALGAATNSNFAIVKLANDVEVYSGSTSTTIGTGALVLPTSTSTGTVLNLNGKTINFSNFAFTGFGTTGSITQASRGYLTNGFIQMTTSGGAATRTFPFDAPISISTGGSSVTTNSSITTIKVSQTAAPTATAPKYPIGSRAYFVQVNGNYGNATGSSAPSVTLTYNSTDNFPAGMLQQNLFVGQATALSGPWTTKSTSFGSSGTLPVPASSKATATASPGPIDSTATSGNSYFAWISEAAVPTLSGSYGPYCSAGGQVVNITGTGFTNVTAVTFNGTNAASYTVNSATSITAYTPSGITAGVIAVTANGSQGQSAAYTITATPSFTPTVTPSNGLICTAGGSVAISLGTDIGADSYTWAGAGLDTYTGLNVVASPSATTTYTVTAVLSGSGCTLTKTFNVGVVPGASIVPTASPASSCFSAGSTVTLSSNLSGGNFSVASIPYAAATAPANATVLVQAGVSSSTYTLGGSLDDGGWQGIPIGFNYNFFGNIFSTVAAGTNGLLMFGPVPGFSVSNGDLGFWQFTTISSPVFPNANMAGNVIAAHAADMYLQQPDNPGIIRFWNDGVAPTRRFIIEYKNVPYYKGFNDATGVTSTFQCILYETTGIVEIHVTSSTYDGSRTRTIGLQDATKTIGAVAPGRQNFNTPITVPEAWRFSPPTNFSFLWSPAANLNNTTSTSVVYTPTTPGVKSVNLTVTNPTTGCSVSTPLSFTVNTTPTSPTVTGTMSVCGSGNTALFSSAPAPGNSIRWYDAPLGGNQVASGTLFTPFVSSDTTFYVGETNAFCASPLTPVHITRSLAAPLTVTDKVLCSNVTSTALSVTSPVGNYDTYIWSPIAGLYKDAALTQAYNGQSLTTVYAGGLVSGTKQYICTANDFETLCSNKDTATITVQPASATITASNTSACISGNDTLTLNSATAIAVHFVQWQISTDGTNFTDIPGADSSIYITGTISSTTYFRALIKNDAGATCFTTANLLITGFQPITVSATAQTVCNNAVAPISITSTLANYDTYKWTPVTNLFTDAAGTIPYTAGSSATTVYVRSTTAATATYTVTANNTLTTCTTTATAAVTTLPATVSITSTPIAICVSGTATLSVSPASGYGTGTFQWQSSTAAEGPFNNIPSATNSTYTTGTINATTYYQVIVKDGAGNVCTTSSVFTLNVNTPAITGTTGDTRCGTGALSLSATGTPGSLIVWYAAPTGGTPLFIGSPFTTPSISATTTYYVADSIAPCISARTGVVATVNNTAPPVTVSVGNTVCNNAVAPITITSSLLDYDVYTWTPVAGLFSDAAGTVPYNGASATTVYARTTTAGSKVFTVHASNSASPSLCTNTDSTRITTLPATVTISSTPSTICISGHSTLSLVPSSGYGAAQFQWQISTDGTTYTDIPSATSNTYTTADITANTFYKATIKDSLGNICTTTAAFTLVVNNPTITGITEASRCGAGSVTLFATGSSGTTLKWYAAATGGSALATGISFATPVLTHDSTFYVEANIGSCVSATRTAVTAHVAAGAPLTATALQTACPNAIVAVSITSNLPDYDLYLWSPVTGLYTDAAATIPYVANTNATTVYVKQSAVGQYIYTIDARSGTCPGQIKDTVVITAPTAITLNGAQTICNNVITQLSVTSALGNYDSYKWTPATNLFTDAAATIPYSSANSATTLYVKRSTQGQIVYTVTANNSTNSCTTTATDTVNVQPPSAVIQSSPATICNSGTATLSLSPSTGYAANSIQWQVSTDGTNFTDIPGANATTYTTQNITATTYYRAKILNGTGGTCFTTAAYTLILNAATVTPASTTVTRCGSGPVTLTATSSAGSTIGWYSAATGGTALATGPSFTTPTVNSTISYYVSATLNGCESPRTSITISISTAPAVVITDPQVVCNNAITPFTIASTISDYTSYVWTPATNLFTDAAATIPYVAGTSATTVYAKSSVAGTTNYTVNASNSNTFCTATATTSLSVQPASAAISSTPANLCLSGSAVLNITPSSPYGVGTLQWQRSTDNISFTDIPAAIGNSYTTPVQSVTRYYRILIKNGLNSLCYTSPGYALVVNNPQVVSTTPGTACGLHTVTLGATGSAGTTLNWYAAATGGSSLATGSTFTTPAISATTTYYVEASIGTCLSGRTAVVATISAPPALTISNSQYACNGNAVALSISSPLANFDTYTWSPVTKLFIDAAGTTPYTANTNASTVYYISATAATDTYTVTSTNTASQCVNTATTTVSSVIVTINSVTATPSTVCFGQSTSLAATGAGTYAYQWNPGSLIGNPVSATPALVGTNTYSVTATEPTSGCTNTGTVNVIVNPLPEAPLANNSNQCGYGIPGAFVTTGFSSGSTSAFRWYSALTGGTLLQTGGASYTSYINTTTTFYVSESNGICESPRTAVTATVSQPDQITAQANITTVCAGSSVNLTVIKDAGDNMYTYTWTGAPAAGSGITGSLTGSSVSVTPTAPGTYVYTVIAVDNNCSTISTVTVTVKQLPNITATATPSTVCAGALATLNGTSVGIVPGPAAVGAGATTSSSSGTPFYGTWGGTKVQYIYTAAELTAAGFVAGNITSLGINVTAAGATTYKGFAINIGATSQSAFSTANALTGLTQVYSGPLADQGYETSVGTNTFVFSSPFAWNGTSNIVVSFCYSNATTSNPASTIEWDTYSTNKGMYIYADSQTPATVCGATTTIPASGGSSTSTGRPKTIFTAPVATNVTNTVTWTWNPGSLSGSTVNVNPTETTTYTATIVDPVSTCSSSATVTVNVNPLPPAPSTSGSEQCGTQIPLASVSSNSTEPTPVFKWYTVPTGGTAVQTGTSTTYLSLVATTTSFYVSEISSFGCEGPRAQVDVLVAPPDALAPTAIATSSCLGNTVTLNANQTVENNSYLFTWTATPAAGSGIPTSIDGDGVIITPTVAGTYTYTVTAVDPDKGCANVQSVVFTVNPLPRLDSVIAKRTTVCSAGIDTLSVYSSVQVNGPLTAPGGYSVSNATNTADEEILNVSFAGILNNSSTCSTTGVGQSILNEYSDFTNLAPTTVIAGTTVPVSVQVGTCGGTFNNWTAVFIDYNRNGTFESNETAYSSATYTSGAHLESGSISIPIDATAGVTLMRVIVREGTVAPSPDGTYSWGETEDYYVKIIGINKQNPAFTYNWTPGALTGPNVVIHPTTSTTYTVTATNPATGCVSNLGTVAVSVSPVGANATATPSTPVCAGTSVTLNGGATGGGPFTYSWSNGATVVGTTASITVNPTVTTTYTVTVTDACSGSTTSTVTVNVLALPTVSVTPTTANFCNPGGTPVTITASGDATGYAWLPAAGLSATTGATVNASPTTSTTYTVTATGANGCTSTATSAITVNVAVTGATASATPNPVCQGSTLSLTASANQIPGYTMNANSGVAFIDISTTGASVGTLSDDSEHPLTLPSFNFNGTVYTQATVGTNGAILLGTTTGDVNLTNAAMPNTSMTGSNVYLAPWWDDLDIQTGATCVTQTVGNNFIVQWTNMAHNDFTTGSVTFQAQLNLVTGVINFVYPDVIFGSATQDAGATATVGIQYSSSSALQYSFNTASLTNGQSITFTPTTLSYSWTGPNSFTSTLQNPTIPNVTSAAAGVYTVTLATNLGCSATVSTSNVAVSPRPTGVLSGSGTYCNGQSTTTALSIAVTGAGPWSGTLLPGNIPFSGTTSPISVNVTPSANTTYTLATLNGSQCSAIAADLSGSATVTINPRPTGVISGSGTYCNGQSTTTALSIAVTGAGPWSGTLSDGTAFSGSASPISVNVTPSATTTYTIATLNGSQCSAIAADLSGSATVTVNPRPTGTLSGSGTYCNGQSTTTALSIAVTGAGPWSGTLLPGNIPFSGTTSPISVNVTPSANTTYTIATLNGSQCSATAADLSGSATVTINSRPTATISGSGAFCQGAANTSTNLTVNFTGTAPWNYTYQVNNGSPVSGTTSSNPLTITVAPSSATAGLFTYTISALSDALCTATDGDWSGSGTVTINPLAATPTATVSAQPTCSVGTGTITVTGPLGTGNSYTLDNVTTITWPTVSFTGVAPGPHTITVTNSFGCSSPASTTVTVAPQPFTPTAPVVTGTINICPHIGTGEQITYTATANGNGNMSFNWTLPPNVNVVSGLGTGTLVVTFPSAAIITQANKQIRVTATNQCGTSTMTIFYLLTQQPNTPNPISGPTDVCPLLGNAAGADYVINKAPGALSYLWSAQQSANVTITHPNGTGVNDTIIHVVFATGFTTSNITVQAVNDCGTSGARSLTVYRITPSTPGLIAGPTNACEFTAPNGTAATYSVAATPGVTYTWTVPSGATGLTGQGTSTISFTYPNGFTSGTISVTATNGCGGPSAPRSLSITKLNPATPSVIDVIQTHFCGENPVGNSRVYTYTLASMPANATSVQWVVPSGASLEGGQGSTSITVRYPDAAVNGVVTAQAVNNCGTSTIRSTVVKLPACPVGFTKAEEPANSNVQPKATTAVTGASMEVKIFPNPTVSDFKLEVLTPGKEEINVRVIDAQGRMYKSFKLMPYQTIALGAELKAGSYLVEVRQGATVKTTKVIKF